jgi:hypothetical protein
MAQNRPALFPAEAAALRQRFADREAGSLETLARAGRARLRQKLAATPVGAARPSFMLPLASGLAGLAILAAAFTILPRHSGPAIPAQIAAHATPALLSPPQTPIPTPYALPVVTEPLFAPRTPHPALPISKRPPAPAQAILQANSDSGAGGGLVEPELRMVKTSAGIAVTWAAAGGEKFILSKTCYSGHNPGEMLGLTPGSAFVASRVMLIGSGEWIDSGSDAAACPQARYEVQRVA